MWKDGAIYIGYTWRHFFENLAGVFIISYYIPNIQGMDIIWR